MPQRTNFGYFPFSANPHPRPHHPLKQQQSYVYTHKWMDVCNTFTAISFISRATELLTSIWCPLTEIFTLNIQSVLFSPCVVLWCVLSHNTNPSISIFAIICHKSIRVLLWQYISTHNTGEWIYYTILLYVYSKVSKFSKMVRVLWSNLHTRLCTDVPFIWIIRHTELFWGGYLYIYTQRRWFWFDVKLYLVFVL